VPHSLVMARLRYFPRLSIMVSCEARSRAVKVYSQTGDPTRPFVIVAEVDTARLGPLGGDGGEVQDVAFIPKLRFFVMAVSDFSLFVLDASPLELATPGAPRLLHRQHTSRAMRVLCYAESSGLLFSCGADNTVVAWAVSSVATSHGLDVRVAERARLSAHAGIVSDMCAAVSTNVLVTGGMDGMLHVWDAGSGAHLAGHDDHDGAVRCVMYHPTSDVVLSAAFDNTIIAWDMYQNYGTPIFRLLGHKYPVVGLVAVDRESYALSVDELGTFKWWDTRRTSGIAESERCLQTFWTKLSAVRAAQHGGRGAGADGRRRGRAALQL
jgi:WD40 repeat protein